MRIHKTIAILRLGLDTQWVSSVELVIDIDRSAPALLSHQISRAVADMIRRGSLPTGSRLPATRELARRLSVGRTTVVEAYDLLAEQGYVKARRGSGTVVARIPWLHKSIDPSARVAKCHASTSAREIDAEIDFRPDLPDLASFPKRRWLASMVRSGRSIATHDLDFGDPLGSARLRRAVAAYLGRSRGLQVNSDNLVITSGRAQIVELVVRSVPFLTEVVVEQPGTVWLDETFAAHRLEVRKLPLDANGIMTDLLPEGEGRKLACVTPDHQWPTGFVMAPERRRALAAWACRNGHYILEHDEDRELSLQHISAAPIASMDPDQRVIYSGTFCKTLVPALRVGFVVLPDEVLERVLAMKWLAERGSYSLHQDALADWLETGAFERHVQRMRHLYWERYQLLTGTLESLLPDRIRIIGEPIGTHVAALVRTGLSAEDLSRKMQTRGVKIHPVEGDFAVAEEDERTFVFGFGNLSDPKILNGVRAFADVVRSD